MQTSSLTLEVRHGKSTAKQRGLTLIEILVVVAIVSILGVVCTPLYQGYKTKTKVGGNIVTMTPVQRSATEYFILNESWPTNNAEAGAKTPESYSANYLTSVAVTETPHPGSILLTYDNTRLRILGNNNTIIFYPVVDGSGTIKWKCDAGTLVKRYRPSTCRT